MITFLVLSSVVLLVLGVLAFLADRDTAHTYYDEPARVVIWCDKYGHYYVFSDHWHCIHCAHTPKVADSDVD